MPVNWLARSSSLQGRRSVLALLFCFSFPLSFLSAQVREPALGATLKGWEESARITIFDRSGSFFGRLAKEGILQRFGHHELDAEYDLDHISFSPSLTEEYYWYQRENGVRFWTGSINHLHLIQNADFSAAVPLGGSWSARAQLTHQRTLQARRSLVRLSLRRELRSRPWQFFLTGTLKDDKPDTDLEAGVTWSAPGAAVTLAGAVLDVFNDFITQTLGVEYLTDSILDYRALPLTGRIAMEVRLSPRWRLEAYALGMTRAEFELSLVSQPRGGFSQREGYSYMAGLLEWTPSSRAALGVLATWLKARIDRRPQALGSGVENFELTEEESRFGIYGLYRSSSRWSGEAWVVRVIRPDERIYRGAGAPPSLRYRDRAWSGKVSGTYQAASGFRAELGLDLVARGIADPGEAWGREFLADNNYRLRFDLGWRFGSRALFVIGSNVDLDRDNGTAIGTFDGGHGRFVLYW